MKYYLLSFLIVGVIVNMCILGLAHLLCGFILLSSIPSPFLISLHGHNSGLKLDPTQKKGKSVTVPDALYSKGCVKNVQEGIKVGLCGRVR